MAVEKNIIQFNQDFDTDWEELRNDCRDIYSGVKDIKEWGMALVHAYILKIREYVSLMNKNENDNQIYEAQLERWLLGTDLMDSLEEQSFICAAHPISLMNKLYYDIAREEIEGICNSVEKEIALSVVASKVKNRDKLSLSFWGNEYKVKTEKDRLKRFETYGSLTQIQGIRLIEKIEDLQNKLNNNHIKIAYFGELTDLDKVTSYFREERRPVFYKYQYMEENIFLNVELNAVVNLRDTFGLMKFIQSYDLVLFLDESYFYKKYQSHKDEKEEKVGTYIDWNYQNSIEEENPLAQINIYYNIFELANKFIKGRNSHMSVEYEYDDQLIKRMEAVVDKSSGACADVYFYMRNMILADRNIELLNVCKDEFYDGKKLIVYKISGNKNNIYIGNNNSNIIQKCQFPQIDFWKIMKSISNEYYDDIWKHLVIRELKNTNIIFYNFVLEKAERQRLIINYGIDIPDSLGSERDREKLVQFANAVFSIIQNNKIMNCVKEYLRELISASILSRANSVRDIMMSYFISKKTIIEFRRIDKENIGKEQFYGTQMKCYKERKNVYTIVEKLEQLRLRDIEQMESFLLYTFKSNYAEEIGESKFRTYLSDIHKICQEIGDTESRLYLYTKIF